MSSESSNFQLTDTRYTNRYGSCVRLTPVNYSKWHSGIVAMLMCGDMYNIATAAKLAPPATAPNASTMSRQYIDNQSYKKRHRECCMTNYNSLSESL